MDVQKMYTMRDCKTEIPQCCVLAQRQDRRIEGRDSVNGLVDQTGGVN